MTPSTLQRQARALGDPTRHAVFRHIAESVEPVAIADLTQRFAFNHNAIRQHLAKLVDAGLVVEATAPPVGPGRPRLVYTLDPAAEGRWGTTGPYERLAGLLAEIIETGHSPQQVGRQAADDFRVSTPSGDVLADMTTAMARQGFAPEPRMVRGGTEIILHACPFVSAASASRSTVCSLHLGIAEGLADGTAIVVDELVGNDPRRANCRLRLHEADPGAAQPATRATLSLRGRSAKSP